MRQEKITPEPAQIGPIPLICQETNIYHPANASDSIPLICQLTITSGLAQFSLVLPLKWLPQAFNTFANPYTQIPPIRVKQDITHYYYSSICQDLGQQFELYRQSI